MNRRKFTKLLSLVPLALGAGCYSTKEGCQDAETEVWHCLIYRAGHGPTFMGQLRDLRRGDAFMISSQWHADWGTWCLAMSNPFKTKEGPLGIQIKVLMPRSA